MRKVILLILLILSISVNAIELGFNQAWLKNKYAHQWTQYDHNEAMRIIDMAKDANASMLRMWLFEGNKVEGIKWKNGKPMSIDQGYLDNLEKFIQYAKDKSIKLNFTFFDGNVILQDSFAKYKDRWWNLLNNKYNVGNHYLNNIIVPVLAVLNKFPSTVTQIDLVNEINALNGALYIYPYMFNKQWRGINKFVCKWSKFVKEKITYPIQITTSFGWESASAQVLSDKLDSSCIDFYDVHYYNNTGTIPSCYQLKAFSKIKNKPIQLGEFGQKSKKFDNELQSSVLKKFYHNAKKCGFSKLLAWRLSDIRSGNNKEARFSFEAFGQPRAAYYIFKDLN